MNLVLKQYQGRFPFVRTGRSDRYIRELNSVVSQICPVKVNTQILYIVMVDLWGNLVEKAHFTFKSPGPAGQFSQMGSACFRSFYFVYLVTMVYYRKLASPSFQFYGRMKIILHYSFTPAR